MHRLHILNRLYMVYHYQKCLRISFNNFLKCLFIHFTLHDGLNHIIFSMQRWHVVLTCKTFFVLICRQYDVIKGCLIAKCYLIRYSITLLFEKISSCALCLDDMLQASLKKKKKRSGKRNYVLIMPNHKYYINIRSELLLKYRYENKVCLIIYKTIPPYN